MWTKIKTIINDFLWGKLKVIEIDLKPTTAVISTGNDSFNITRKGFIDLEGSQFMTAFDGEEVVKSYLKCAKNYYETDEGRLIPIHTVIKIQLDVKSDIKRVEYR